MDSKKIQLKITYETTEDQQQGKTRRRQKTIGEGFALSFLIYKGSVVFELGLGLGLRGKGGVKERRHKNRRQKKK